MFKASIDGGKTFGYKKMNLNTTNSELQDVELLLQEIMFTLHGVKETKVRYYII
jgi:hypothetical protein